MKFRKLRIAWSVGLGLVSVLLILFWALTDRNARSYQWRLSRNERVTLFSDAGTLFVTWYTENDVEAANEKVIGDEFDPQMASQIRDLIGQHRVAFGTTRLSAKCSYLRLTVIVGTIAIAPWCVRRFGLRALLIATTLVAVVLGLAVYAAGK